jgi:two-component system, CAI-1 autoinducer sensor kinase/phosphatase CqsS
MKYLRKLFACYEDYCSHRKGILRYASLVGAIGFLLFHFIYTLVLPQPYENLTIRLIAAAACAVMAMPNYWPARLRKYYIGCSYVVVLYCLPFFHVFMSLKNHGNIVFIADSFMAVFFLVLLTDWRNTIAMLCLGTILGVALYMATTAHPVLAPDYIARLPTFILVVVGGSLFKFSERQLQDAKLRGAVALAGSIAHEMRNPLGRIQYSLDMASRALPEPTTDDATQTLSGKQIEDVYAQLSQGQRAVQRGLQVIAMTLEQVNVKTIDTSKVTRIQAADVVQKALAEYAYETEGERSVVSLLVHEDFTFDGDETLFMFVLFNLFKNALYYVKRYPDMRLVVTVDEPHVFVTDTGPGIPKSLQTRLFESFQTSGKAGGTGLGLAYCKRAMVAIGGDIFCDSAEGEGTRFTLRFPRAAQAAPDENSRALREDSLAIFEGKRILLVDDDAMQRSTLRKHLGGLGVEIDEAENGQLAIDRIKQAHYDLVLMDLHMPVLDGYAATGMIRGGLVPAMRFVPILGCSSDPEHLVHLKTERAGMTAIVPKACSRAELLRAVQSCLEHPGVYGEPLAGKTAILADDDEYGRRIVRTWLEKYGLEVREANHGQAVLDMLAEDERCDVIMLDLQMPGLNGIETTRAIRARPGTSGQIPIIALTGYSDSGTIESAVNAGMNDIATKPVRGPALVRTLIQHMHPGANGARWAATAAVPGRGEECSSSAMSK